MQVSAIDPAISVALLWMLFAAGHIGLATQRTRHGLVGRLGEGGFIALFSAIAALNFTVLVVYFVLNREFGAALPWRATDLMPGLRAVCIGSIALGASLMATALISYRESPMSMPVGTVREPTGIARITRHGFFVGVALFGLAHLGLVGRWVDFVFFAGFAVVSIAGAIHQDRKLLARLGRPYAEYLETTSLVPFGAILQKRQYLAWNEMPWAALAVGIALAVGLRAIHGPILAYGGAGFVAATLGPAARELWIGLRRRRQLGAATTT
jgi:uncharacterized membrane protein